MTEWNDTMIMNDEPENMGNKIFAVYIKVPSQRLHGVTEETHLNLSRYPVSGHRLELVTSRVPIGGINRYNMRYL